MKKKEAHIEHEVEQETEILKAVAQAWHGHSSNVSRPTNEFEGYRRNFETKPSRFKLEAMNMSLAAANNKRVEKWDFAQSLWDSYEIVTISKRLESGLVFDRHSMSSDLDGLNGAISVGINKKKGRENKNSLRNLINIFWSRRFDEPRISKDL